MINHFKYWNEKRTINSVIKRSSVDSKAPVVATAVAMETGINSSLVS